MKKTLKRYRGFLIMLTAFFILLFVNKPLGIKTFNITTNSIFEMMLVIPPIFILLGLLDVWVPKETMIKYMGEGSGLKGIILAFLIGSAAAGPLYGAFPVAAIFMKKGVKFINILIFIGAWSTTKIPLLLFEISSLGAEFAGIRLILNLFGILIIASLIAKIVPKEEVERIYENANANL